MIKTFRHDYNTIYMGKYVCAPRMFIDNERNEKYCVHIDKDALNAYVFAYVEGLPISLDINGNVDTTCILSSILKIYSCEKGNYFLWNRWICNDKKKQERVYLCD